jgi:hypothetical protein
MTRRLAFRVLITMLALVLACDGDDRFVSVGEGGDREPTDGGAIDGMDGASDGSDGSDGNVDEMDGSMSGDGSFLDSVDLPDGSIVLGDGAIQLPDGEIIDEETAEMRYGSEVDVTTCEVSELDSLSLRVEFGNESGYSIAASGSSGFGLAVNATTTSECLSNISVSVMPSTGALPLPTSMLDDCSVTGDVALHGVRGGYHIAWVDNITTTSELHHAMLDRDLKPIGALTRTTITDSAPELEMKPIMATISERPLLAWITRNAETQKKGVMGKFLAGDDTDAFEIIGADEGHDPQGIAASRMSVENRGAVAWVGPEASPGVWVQPLYDTGHPDGGPVQLTARVGASSSVDLAPRVDGGGAVYSIAIDSIPQVRFRRLDHFGQPRDDERTLISAPVRAQDASIAGLGGGYAVAYRQLPADGVANAEIRVLFISKEGNVTRDDQGRVISFLGRPQPGRQRQPAQGRPPQPHLRHLITARRRCPRGTRACTPFERR